MADGKHIYDVIDQMKEITGEVAVRSFFGDSTKNKTMSYKSMNQEITYLF